MDEIAFDVEPAGIVLHFEIAGRVHRAVTYENGAGSVGFIVQAVDPLHQWVTTPINNRTVLDRVDRAAMAMHERVLHDSGAADRAAAGDAGGAGAVLGLVPEPAEDAGDHAGT